MQMHAAVCKCMQIFACVSLPACGDGPQLSVKLRMQNTNGALPRLAIFWKCMHLFEGACMSIWGFLWYLFLLEVIDSGQEAIGTNE